MNKLNTQATLARISTLKVEAQGKDDPGFARSMQAARWLKAEVDTEQAKRKAVTARLNNQTKFDRSVHVNHAATELDCGAGRVGFTMGSLTYFAQAVGESFDAGAASVLDQLRADLMRRVSELAFRFTDFEGSKRAHIGYGAAPVAAQVRQLWQAAYQAERFGAITYAELVWAYSACVHAGAIVKTGYLSELEGPADIELEPSTI
jgi:hypothetical protein